MSERRPPRPSDPHDEGAPHDAPLSEGEGIEGLDELIEAVASSAKPRPIDADVHDAILARALGIDLAATGQVDEPAEPPPTAAEIEWGTLLGRALDQTDAELEVALRDASASDVVRLAALARALRLAFAPISLDQLSQERLLRPALKQPSRRANTRMLYGAVAVAMTLAAVFAGLWVKTAPNRDGGSARLDAVGAVERMTRAQSTEALFEPMQAFPREGGTTDRIDKIAEARAGDLRHNRFEGWGVE